MEPDVRGQPQAAIETREGGAGRQASFVERRRFEVPAFDAATRRDGERARTARTHVCANDPMTSGLLSSGSHFFPMTSGDASGRTSRAARSREVARSSHSPLSKVGASALPLSNGRRLGVAPSNSGFVHPSFTLTYKYPTILRDSPARSTRALYSLRDCSPVRVGIRYFADDDDNREKTLCSVAFCTRLRTRHYARHVERTHANTARRRQNRARVVS